MKCNEKNYNILVIIILLIMLVLNVLSFFKKDSARNLETIKVGWVENMEAVQKLYKSDSYISQQSAAIDQALSQVGLNVDTTEPTDVDNNIGDTNNIEDVNNVEDTNVWGDVNQEMIDNLGNIKSSAIIHGDENARFTILEYSELLCPYCKRQSDQWTINSVLEKYPSEVNSIFRNFIVHAPAAKLAEGILCVGELWWDKKYFDFIEDAFAHQGTLDTDAIVDIADDLWVKEKDMRSCLDSGKYTNEVTQQTAEGRNLFGVTWTPGNVIIDKLTGKFVLIPGAYPPEKFIEEIDKMKNSN